MYFLKYAIVSNTIKVLASSKIIKRNLNLSYLSKANI